MSKLFQYGGIVASVVLIAFGAGSIVTGYNGRDRVHSDLAREQIVGTPDSSIPNQLVNNGTKAEAFAKVMRKHTLEATGGQTYAQMGRYMGKNGKPTNDQKLAAVNAKTGQPVDNPLRNLWVTETALTTALHSSYFAESVATFAIVMGFALMITGGGFLVLTLRVMRVFDKEERDRACGRAERGRALELIARRARSGVTTKPPHLRGLRRCVVSRTGQRLGPDGTSALCRRASDHCLDRRKGATMPMLIDAPSGVRPPKLTLPEGVPVYVLMMWWRGGEISQDAIPEASAQAQVEAAHGRHEAMA